MARAKNTKTHNIFLLDENKLPKANGATLPTPDALAQVMTRDAKYQTQALKPGVDKKGFTIRLYFRGDDNYQSQFASFCKPFIADGEPAVSFYPRSVSSVMFIWNDRHIYAVTTGQGFRMIEDFAVPKFGLIVASIYKGHFKVTSLDSNAMSSIVHSTKTVYSNEVDFIDVDALDTVFKEVTGRLKDATKVSALLNLDATSKKQSMKVTAKNFVQFSSSLNFDGLLHLLTVIDTYDFEPFQDCFNLIAPLNSKKNREIIQANNDALAESMYAAISTGQRIPFDLFHRETMDYISAENYTIYDSGSGDEYVTFADYAAVEAVADAYKTYLGENPDTFAAFSTFVKEASLRAEKGDHTITDATLMRHLSGEIRVGNTNYYVFYGEYYSLNESYTDRLNNSLSGKLRKEFYTTEIQQQWPRGNDEDWFNLQASVNEDYIHLHKVKPDYIEFADLMKYENDEVTIVHVKDGFDCDMRALDRQVELSVTKIMDIKHNNNSYYMRALYEKASAHTVGKNITTVFATVDDFLECMINKPIRYIIVLRPGNKQLLDNPSNIAKHCLNALIMRCFQQGIELRIQVM